MDVNTARNVSIDSHYLLKYGSLFAASFLSGLNDAAKNIGTTTQIQTGQNAQIITTQSGSLDKTKVIAAGLGRVGDNLVTKAEEFQNIEPTIRMKAGSTFGILVMDDYSLAN